MFLKLKDSATLNATNFPGWRTRRKIVVIESDDWGTVRMNSKLSYERLLQKGYPVDKNEYNKFDALETNSDLNLLFQVLQSVKDTNNNPAIITANNIVANPDFEKIRDSNFTKYYYQPFTETLLAYPEHERVMELYKQGIHHKVLLPQLHGREHINLTNWMNALQTGNTAALDAFEEKMFTVAKNTTPSCRKEFLDGFGTFSEAALLALEDVITEAADLFEQIWGFRSTSIIAPCYTWHPTAEKYFFNNGIRYIQGGRVQKIPKINGQGIKYKRHFTGQVNSMGQLYLVRNAFFEPFSNPSKDWIDSCLNEIQNSFFWGKPAIISSHRVNFMGSLNRENRTNNLKLLKHLLQRIVVKWPSVEFMTTNQLGDLITKN